MQDQGHMTSMASAESTMAEKLARWKAQKMTQSSQVNGQPSKPLTRQKTNLLPSKSQMNQQQKVKKKSSQPLLPEPKSLLQQSMAPSPKKGSLSKSSIKEEDPSNLLTQTLPKYVFESALAIVDAMEGDASTFTAPMTGLTPPRRGLLPVRDVSPILSKNTFEFKIETLESENAALAKEKMEFLQKFSRLEETIQTLNGLIQEKDATLEKVSLSNSELISKVAGLTDHLSELEAESDRAATQRITLEEKIIKEYQETSDLRLKVEQLNLENKVLKEELADFESLLEEMKAVAQESEEKDTKIIKLTLEAQSTEDTLFALEAQVYKAEQDNLKSLASLENLQREFDQVSEQLAKYKVKEELLMINQSSQTMIICQQSAQSQTAVFNHSESSSCQTDPLPPPPKLSVDTDKQISILKMSNSVLFQEIQGMQKAHDAVVKGMQERMASENEKWQQLELTQTAMQRKIMETLEKAVNKNRELKKELEIEKEKNSFFKSSSPEKPSAIQ